MVSRDCANMLDDPQETGALEALASRGSRR